LEKLAGELVLAPHLCSVDVCVIGAAHNAHQLCIRHRQLVEAPQYQIQQYILLRVLYHKDVAVVTAQAYLSRFAMYQNRMGLKHNMVAPFSGTDFGSAAGAHSL